MHTTEMDTPFILIDQAVMKRNVERMARMAREAGVRLRPHAKTHKMPEVAKQQIGEGACGITVAKLSEAETMADHGIVNIFVAYPIVSPPKLERLIRLDRRADVIVGVDSMEGASRLSAAAVTHDRPIRVRLEIETGLRRTGVALQDAVKLAYEISRLPSLEMDGIFTFRGAQIQGQTTMDIEAAGLEEGRLMAGLADAMRKQGIALQEVSVGSSPTSASAAQVPGVTEVRPGTYVFNDRMQMRWGLCGEDDCAAKVVATVVSRPSAEYAVIDGGSKTFATDVQPNTAPLNLAGFGKIEQYPDAVLERMNEEHGMIRFPGGCPLRVGDQVKIVPNHICSTVNLHDTVMMYDPDTGSLREIAVVGRGKLK